MSELVKEIPEVEETSRVDDDQKAEECIRAIREAEANREFWKNYYLDQMAKVNATCDNTIEAMKERLRAYFDTVPHNKTKTQENYQLPSGKLVLKQREPEYTRTDSDVIKWLKDNGGKKFVKIKESLDWSGLKKTLTVIGETVADSEGHIIPCIKAVERPDEFTIDK